MYVRDALQTIGVEGVSFSVEQPQEVTHGDYATNVALIACKKLGLSPKETAEKIKNALEGKHEEIARIEIAGVGFINFFLKDEVIRESNKEIIGTFETKYTGKNILVEHSSPNLFKPFSIGHLMNNIIGEFVVRATNLGGGNVEAMAFPSDISLGIAKALFIIEKDIHQNKISFEYFSKTNEDEVIKYLGDAYVQGVKECEENEESLKEAKKVLDKMYHLKSGEFYDLALLTRVINEKYFKRILKEIGSEINRYEYEREAGYEGEIIVKQNTGEGKVFIESEGAIVYTPNEERKDINTSVFINSQGYPTYEAKDLGLLILKFSVNNFYPDYSYFITDSEQISHFKVVLDAASKLGGDWPSWVEKSKHIPHGRMLFKGAKMSSRLGGVPLALDVIETVEEEVDIRSSERVSNLQGKERADLLREIALSALRISVLRSKPGININFDPESSLSFEGDSGPYLLYTHARCASLLEKGKDTTPSFGEYEVTTLEKNLIHAEEIFVKTIEDLSPQTLVTYLFSVAQLFNGWYAEVQIISDDKDKTAHNLALVTRVKNILNKGLYILGIEAPMSM